MTVKELIEKLQAMPQDEEVMTLNDGCPVKITEVVGEDAVFTKSGKHEVFIKHEKW